MESVDDAVQRFCEGLSGDRKILDATLADDGVLGMGAAPGELSDDRELLLDVLTGEAERFHSSVVPVGALHTMQENGVAWAVTNAEMRLGDGGRLPLRMTIVFRADGGSWRVTHWHTSVGVPNEEIFDRFVERE